MREGFGGLERYAPFRETRVFQTVSRRVYTCNIHFFSTLDFSALELLKNPLIGQTNYKLYRGLSTKYFLLSLAFKLSFIELDDADVKRPPLRISLKRKIIYSK